MQEKLEKEHFVQNHLYFGLISHPQKNVRSTFRTWLKSRGAVISQSLCMVFSFEDFHNFQEIPTLCGLALAILIL